MSGDKELSAFIIYINPQEFKGNTDQFNEFIKQNNAFESWWNFIPLFYTVTSREDVNIIRDRLHKFVGNNCDIFVAKIDPRNVAGRLNTGAFDAFRTDISQRIYADFAGPVVIDENDES